MAAALSEQGPTQQPAALNRLRDQHRVDEAALFSPRGTALAVAGTGIAIWLGLVPDAVANGAAMPVWMLALALAVVAGLVIAVLRLDRPVIVLAAAAPVTALALHLVLNSLLWSGYDPAALAATLAQGEPLGLATTDTGYAGQFTFAGRLAGPITVLASDDARRAWLAANPGGIVVARGDLAAPGLTLLDQRDFQGKPYRLYRVAKVQP